MRANVYALVANAQPVGRMVPQSVPERTHAPRRLLPCPTGGKWVMERGVLVVRGQCLHCVTCRQTNKRTPQKRRKKRQRDPAGKRIWTPRGPCCATCWQCREVPTNAGEILYQRECDYAQAQRYGGLVGFATAGRKRAMACEGAGWGARGLDSDSANMV